MKLLNFNKFKSDWVLYTAKQISEKKYIVNTSKLHVIDILGKIPVAIKNIEELYEKINENYEELSKIGVEYNFLIDFQNTLVERMKSERKLDRKLAESAYLNSKELIEKYKAILLEHNSNNQEMFNKEKKFKHSDFFLYWKEKYKGIRNEVHSKKNKSVKKNIKLEVLS